MYRISRIFFWLAIPWLAAMNLGATTLQPLSSEDLAREAEQIVIGRCLDAQSQWFGGALVTLVTVEIDESLKGDATHQITLAVPGGVDNRGEVPLSVTYAGAPVIGVGDEMLLFLRGLAGDVSTFKIVGFSQGLFPVVRDSDEVWVAQSRTSLRGALSLGQVRSRIQEDLAKIEATGDVDSKGGES